MHFFFFFFSVLQKIKHNSWFSWRRPLLGFQLEQMECGERDIIPGSEI